MAIGTDNAGAFLQGNAAGSFKRSLYMARRVRFVQEATDSRQARVYKVRAEDNEADILTKILTPRLFKRFRHAIQNVREIAAQMAAISARQCTRVRFV